MKKAFLLLAALLPFAAAYGWEIVKDGQPAAVIVIPAQPNPVENYAAEELRYIVGKATGARLEIVKGTASGNRILIGRAAGLPANRFSAGQYLVKTTGNMLILAGQDGDGAVSRSSTASGSLYAVYKWAEEQMKVFWLWPDEKGEVIPNCRDLDSGKFDLAVTPKLRFARVRRWSWKWSRRMLRADCSRLPGNTGASSTGHAFIDWYKRYWKTHPDFFAMDDSGKRRHNGAFSAMCVSNPKFHRQIVENWKAAGKPKLSVNVKENDTYGSCCCKNCLAWDADTERRWPTGQYDSHPNVGERYAKFYLAVQKLARAVDPEAKVEGYAYLNFVYAPTRTKLNPGVIVGFVDDLHFPRTAETQAKVDRELKLWHASGATLYMRPNFFLQCYAMPELFFRQYAGEFRLAEKCGCIGLDVDGPNNSWATVGANLFVLARLVAEPDQNVDRYLDQYCSAFGKAAPAVRKYIDYWEKYTMGNAEKFNRIYMEKTTARSFMFGWDDPVLAHYFFPAEVFAPAEKILAEAAALAKGDPLAEYRVRFLRQGLTHAKLCSRAAAIFADEKSPNAERRKILDTIDNFRRKQMLPNVADVVYFEETNRNEGKHWKLHVADLNEALALPEKWEVAVGGKEVKEAFDAGNFPAAQELSTWKFLEDQGEKDYRYAWYRTTFTIPAEKRDQSSILRLGAVDETCICKVNGKVVGTLVFDAKENPDSWKTPLEFPIDKAIDRDGKNTIDLLVVNAQGKGGLWRPSYVRFERPGTGQLYRPSKFRVGRDGFFSQRKEGKVTVSQLVGKPDAGRANSFLAANAPIGFADVAGRTFRLKATVRTRNLRQGEFQVMIRQVKEGMVTIRYDGFTFRRSRDWDHYTTEVKVDDNAVTLYLYLIGRNMNRGAVGEVKNISVEPLQ